MEPGLVIPDPKNHEKTETEPDPDPDYGKYRTV
jgi:hypothetical protein